VHQELRPPFAASLRLTTKHSYRTSCGSVAYLAKETVPRAVQQSTQTRSLRTQRQGVHRPVRPRAGLGDVRPDLRGDSPDADTDLGWPAVQLPGQRYELASDSQLASFGVEVVAVQGGGFAAAQAAQRDQPPRRRQLVVLHPGQEGDKLAQRPDRDLRPDAVSAPGLDPLVCPDDRVRPGRLVQPYLGQRVAGDEALADRGVQRCPQCCADPVDGGRASAANSSRRVAAQDASSLSASAAGDPAGVV